MFIQILVSLVVIFVTWTVFINLRPRNFPKGPISWPVLGNLPQIAIYQKGVFWHLLFKKYAEIYGDIFSIQLGPRPTSVVVSDVKLIREAYNNAVIQGRPPMLSFDERTGGVRRGILFNDGEEWHEQRRFALRHLRDFGFGKTSMEHMILDEALELIEELKKDSGKPIRTQNRFNIAILNALWCITSGERFKHDDPELKEIIAGITRGVGGNLTSVLVSFFPVLAKLCPNLIGWNALKQDMAYTYNYLKKFTDKQLKSYDGSINHFADVFIQEIKRTTDDKSSFYGKRGELTMTAVMLDLFVAGAETTSTTLTWACLYLSLNPDKQKKLHEELDRVLGTKTPSLDDRSKLSYTEAVIMETLRFSSLVPMVAHTTTEETKLGEYVIPKGREVFANLYAIHHSEKIWGDPENFRPERFLEADGSCSGKHENLIPFAIGKRACLGESLARNELYLFLTSIFQNFEVTWDRNAPKPTLEGVDGAVFGPKPHELIFTSRR